MTSVEVRTAVFVDADNTLWDTNAVFAHAQLVVLADVAQALSVSVGTHQDLDFVRALDQAIAARHHAGLRYPVSLLIRGLELALEGMSPKAAARAAWSGGRRFRIDRDSVLEIERRYFGNLGTLPTLRAGVLEGLEWLHAQNCLLFIVTEGDKLKVEQTAEQHGVLNYFEQVIAAPKTPELYQRVLRLVGTPRLAFMIGDQLGRDIVPAKAAGLRTVYFSGGFQPKWIPRAQDAEPDYTISSFADIRDIFEREYAANR